MHVDRSNRILRKMQLQVYVGIINVYKFPLDNFHQQDPSTITESSEMPTKSRIYLRRTFFVQKCKQFFIWYYYCPRLLRILSANAIVILRITLPLIIMDI